MKRLTLALLALLALALLFGHLGRSALYFDEAIYAEVSKEMVEGGDWITPHWNGHGWFQKPPAYFWATGVLFRLSQVSEFWARFASALSGIGVLLLCYLIARLIYSHAAGVLAVLILLSSQLFVFYARFGTTDMMLTFFIMLAVYAYLRSSDDDRFWLLAGVSCAMALMVKGAAGVIAPVALLVAALLDGRLRLALRGRWLWLGFASAAIIVIPWHLLMYRQHGQTFVNDYLFKHVVNRAKSNINEYQRGFGYYLMVLRDFFSPWAYILPFALIFRRGARSIVVVTLGVMVLGFYTIVQTKFQWYILPAIPAFAVVIAGFVAGYLEKTTRSLLAIATLAFVLLCGFGMFGVISLLKSSDPEMEAGARLARRAARDAGGLIAYPENLEMTVRFYSGRKLCTDPVISKLSHDESTECGPTEATHIILRKSDWDKIADRFTIGPIVEDGPLTYATITRR